MHKKRNITKYLVPVLFALVVAAALLAGVLYIRSYMMKQTVQERSSQLEEMISQIRANMDSGLETHWNLVAGIKATAEGEHYNNEQELTEAIGKLEKAFCTDLYGCRVMLLDSMGTAHLVDGDAGIWDDISRLADGEEQHTFVSDTSNVDGTFLAFTQKLDQPITVGEDENRFTHLVLLKDIETLKNTIRRRVTAETRQPILLRKTVFSPTMMHRTISLGRVISSRLWKRQSMYKIGPLVKLKNI